MNITVFNKFRKIVYDKAGITLHEGKQSLVSARIGKRMRVLGIPDDKKYLEYVMADKTGTEIVQLLDVISTNVTHFFREDQHFQFMGEEVQRIVATGQNKIRIWSAASSSGEEPYSIAMTFLENSKGFRGDIRILATDISTRILKAAKEGTYSKEKVQKVPLMLRSRYFDVRAKEGEKAFVIKPSVSKHITFARLNLNEPPFPMHGPFDLVFCRNVMIYFDNTVRKRLLSEISRLLRPGGYLFVGHAESLTGMLCGLRTVKPSIYVKDG